MAQQLITWTTLSTWDFNSYEMETLQLRNIDKVVYLFVMKAQLFSFIDKKKKRSGQNGLCGSFSILKAMVEKMSASHISPNYFHYYQHFGVLLSLEIIRSTASSAPSKLERERNWMKILKWPHESLIFEFNLAVPPQISSNVAEFKKLLQIWVSCISSTLS